MTFRVTSRNAHFPDWLWENWRDLDFISQLLFLLFTCAFQLQTTWDLYKNTILLKFVLKRDMGCIVLV